jgi:4-amino-4-deoxy-L-arabinose transferase-like glycosyltransferase
VFWAVVAALAVRLIVVAFVYQGFLNPGRDHWEFGYETGKIARSILTGNGFGNPYYGGNTGPTAEIAPLFPYIIAGVMAVFGIYTKASAIVILGLNSLSSALTCIPIFFLAKRTFGEREGRWAAWTWAFFPYAVYFSAASMWDHALTALLLSCLLLMAIQLQQSTHAWKWTAFGALWGVSALTCPVVLGTLPFVVAWICYRLHQQHMPWLRPAVLAGVCVLMTIAPWMIRNYRTFHQPVFLKDGFPLALLAGNFGNTVHWWNGSIDPCGNPTEMAEYRRSGEIVYMKKKWHEAFDFLKNNPYVFVVRSLRRPVYIWTGYWSFRRDYLREERFDPENIVFCTSFTILALLGLRQAFRTNRDNALLYVSVLLVFPLVYYITHPDIAYRQPLDPLIVILGSQAMLSWITSRKGAEEEEKIGVAEVQHVVACKNGVSW